MGESNFRRDAGGPAGAVVGAAAAALATVAASAWAMSPPMPEMHALLPPDGGLPPNAALVLHGFSDGEPRVTVKLGKTPVAVTVAFAGSLGFGYGGQSVWHVRPAKGDWPPGAALEAVVAYASSALPLKVKLKVSKARDAVPPVPGPLGPGRIAKVMVPMMGEREFHFLPYAPMADDATAGLLLVLELSNPKTGAVTTVHTIIASGVAGELRIDPTATRCLGGTLTDAASNVTKVEAAACIGAK